MAAVPVTLVGLFTTDTGESGQITISGLMNRSDLSVGGGPIVPTPPPGNPTHPIVPPGGYDKPEHPIVLPPEPPDPPDPPELGPPGDVAVKPPPASGGWAYVSTWGWGYFPGPGEAGPKGASLMCRSDKPYAYHKPSTDGLAKITRLREKFSEVEQLIRDVCPDSRHRAVALTNNETTAMWAIKAVVFNDPASEV